MSKFSFCKGLNDRQKTVKINVVRLKWERAKKSGKEKKIKALCGKYKLLITFLF